MNFLRNSIGSSFYGSHAAVFHTLAAFDADVSVNYRQPRAFWGYGFHRACRYEGTAVVLGTDFRIYRNCREFGFIVCFSAISLL